MLKMYLTRIFVLMVSCLCSVASIGEVVQQGQGQGQGGTSAVEHIAPIGFSINISCVSYDIPSQYITWRREDGRYLQDGSLSSRGRELQLVNLQESDAGNYICTVDSNVRPPTDYKVKVSIDYKPACTHVKNTVGQAQNRRFEVKLECICAGDPSPTVTWQKLTNHGRVDIREDAKYGLSTTSRPDDKYSVLSKYTLKVRNVQANYYTEYYCIAQNSYAQKETKFRIVETMECQGENCPSSK